MCLSLNNQTALKIKVEMTDLSTLVRYAFIYILIAKSTQILFSIAHLKFFVLINN